jgi:hypothetical protein
MIWTEQQLIELKRNSKIEKSLDISTMTAEEIFRCRVLFYRGALGFLLHSAQKKMKENWEKSGSDEYLVFCSRQLGKTHLGLVIAIIVCIIWPGSRVLYYGPVKDKLKDIVNDGLAPILLFAPVGLIHRKKSEYRWQIGKSELRLCTLERAHIDKYRGWNAKGLIVIEEGCFVDSEAFSYAWQSVIHPQRLRHNPKVLINTTPSTDEDHYIHTVLLPELEAKGAVANYTIYENPFLTLEQIEKMKKQVTNEVWRREYLAEIFRSITSVAVPEFNERHVVKIEAPPAYANWQTVIDFGGSLDPHGIWLNYWDSKRSKYVMWKCHLMPPNSSIKEIVDFCLEFEKDKTLGRHDRVIDCSGQVSIELSRLKFDHMLPQKGPGSFDANLQALRVAFQNDVIEVNGSCTDGINQLKYGKLNKNRDDFFRNEKHHCDLIASAMYGFKVKVTHDPFPAHYGFSKEKYHRPTPPKSNLALLGEI